MTNNQPASPSSGVQDATQSIRSYITKNHLGVGDALPSEKQLSEELGVSRTVVREALRALSALSLIEISNGRRARVSAVHHGGASVLFEHGVRMAQFSVLQIYDVRRTIEMRTAFLAASRRSESHCEKLLALTREMRRRMAQPLTMIEQDVTFHSVVAAASGNPVFTILLQSFQPIIREMWPVGWRARSTVEEHEQVIHIHEQIAEAITRQDSQQASQFMAEHFDLSSKALLLAGIH